MSRFHGAFATGVACQQGTLTLPDTWFRPSIWDLLVLELLRPDSSSLPCLYSTENNLWIPSPTHQTSTQDPTSDKSQGGGGPDPRSPPLDPRLDIKNIYAIYELPVSYSKKVNANVQ